MSALRTEGLTGGWAKQDLLSELTLAVAPGERVAVLGPNGAGKTTLFDLLSGRLRPRRGRVHLGDDDVTRLPLHLRARRGLAYVHQHPTVFRDLSVRQNLATALSAPARRPGPDGEEELELLLRRFALRELADRRADVLSGGERRRVEVARALLLRPTVLLLDEPFAGLDPRGRTALRTGLEALPARTALLITDHAADDLLALCERVVVLVDGRIAFDGPRTDFTPGAGAWARYFG